MGEKRASAIEFIFQNNGTADDTYAIQAMPDGTFLSGLNGLLHAGQSITVNYSWANTPGDTTGFQNTDGDLGTYTTYGWDRNSDGAGFNADCYCYTNTSDLAVITVSIGVAAPPCFTNLTWNLQNKSLQPQTYVACEGPPPANYDSISGPAPATGGYLDLQPGQSGTLAVNVPCTNAALWGVYLVTGFYTQSQGQPPQVTTQPLGTPTGATPTGTPSAGSGPATPDSSAPSQGVGAPSLPNGGNGQYNPTNQAVSGTNSPIVYSSTNTMTTVQQGDSAIYTAIVDGFDQAHKDATGISSDIVTGLQAVVGAIQGNTNGSGLGTNISDYDIPESGTDYNSAVTEVNSRLSSAEGAFAANKANLIGSSYTEGDDSPGDMTLSVMAGSHSVGTIDYNPLHNTGVNSIFVMAKKWIAWLLVASYFLVVIKDTLETIKWLSDAKTRTVAPLDIAGSNPVGLVLSLAGSVAVMLAWSAVLAVLLTWTISGFDVFGVYNTNPLAGGLAAAGGPSGAMGLAEAFFPFPLFFALVSSYVTWRMTYGGALLVGLAVIRMMFGG